MVPAQVRVLSARLSVVSFWVRVAIRCTTVVGGKHPHARGQHQDGEQYNGFPVHGFLEKQHHCHEDQCPAGAGPSAPGKGQNLGGDEQQCNGDHGGPDFQGSLPGDEQGQHHGDGHFKKACHVVSVYVRGLSRSCSWCTRNPIGVKGLMLFSINSPRIDMNTAFAMMT